MWTLHALQRLHQVGCSYEQPSLCKGLISPILVVQMSLYMGYIASSTAAELDGIHDTVCVLTKFLLTALT